MFIREVKARIIRNSRKEKSIEVFMQTYKGKFYASSPEGKSRGKNEVEPYNKRGINYTLKMLNAFFRLIKHRNFMIKDFFGLKEFETEIRKFENKYGRFGGDAVIALENCFLKAAAKENKKEVWKFIFDSFYKGKVKMPMPVGNCLGGGKHSRPVEGKKPDFQEFLLIPNEKSFSRAVTKNIHAYEHAKHLIKNKEKKWILKRNDEGAWMTGLNNESALELLKEIGKEYKLRIGIDIASSSFYKNGYYYYENKKLIRDRVEQIDYIEYLIKKFGLFYIEDPLSEEDFAGFAQLSNLQKKALIVGDDLTTTNLTRLRRAKINAVIIKPNQIGSLLEVSKVVEYCKKENIKMIFSHRSGETIDDVLADLCIGFQGDFIKCGIFGKERLIKLRRVMEIEKSLTR